MHVCPRPMYVCHMHACHHPAAGGWSVRSLAQLSVCLSVCGGRGTGPAAILAQNNIKKVSPAYRMEITGRGVYLYLYCLYPYLTETPEQVEVLDNEEDGMEAVWRIEVVDFPAFIVVDDKGNDFFKSFGL